MEESFASFEKKGWSDPDVARIYADKFARASEMCVPALVSGANAGPGRRALDLCCGQGIVAAGLVDAGAEVTGIDFSPAMLDLARANVSGATFEEGDAGALVYPDDSFDCATMGFGILHVPDAQTTLNETARVLKPGGAIAWSCWHGPEKTSLLPVFFAACMTHGDPSVKLPPSPPAYHYAQPENATPIMEAAGFDDISFETVEAYWLCERPDEPVEIMRDGAVRAAGLLNRQPEENRRAILNKVSEWVENECPREANGRFRVPMPAVVVSGRLSA